MSRKTRKGRASSPSRGTRRIAAWVFGVFFAAAVVVAVTVDVVRSRPAKESTAPAPSGTAFALTKAGPSRPPTTAPEGMVWIPGGEFSMGGEESADSLCSLSGLTRDARPIHRVQVDGFWIDATEVTNEQFETFVQATGYVTVAERVP